jgi:fumarylacetoacetase
MTLVKSWVESANSPSSPFPLNNLPCGVFSAASGAAHCGVAIGDMIVDVTRLERERILQLEGSSYFDAPVWNRFMAAGPKLWSALREQLTELLKVGSSRRRSVEPHLVSQKAAALHLPLQVAEYTDFYAGRHHAQNVGTMFRGPENALPPNWLHIPIGYNGRASSVVVSGTPVTRPWGQVKGPDDANPRFAPSQRFDIELEMAAIVGLPSQHGRPVTVAEADAMIFGYVLLNDWSARDIQAWEYQPLGPFQAKATATSISPWIVMKAALETFRVSTPTRDVPLLPYLHEPRPMLYDIDLEIGLMPAGKSETIISRTNYRELYYSAPQQLAHHTTSGCAMNTGDLLGSGTISGPGRKNRGSLLELSWGGKEPITLADGVERRFIEDHDTLTLRGWAKGNGYTIGFGECVGQLLPALADPYAR